jgi:hypothetical protein
LAAYPNEKEAAASMEEPEQHISTTEARQGVTPHVTRYVLSISLLLIVIIFGILLLVWR